MVLRYSSLTASIRSACAAPRLKARNVGRPRTTSRKWFDRRASASHRARVFASVYRPISTMNTGISGRVASMITAEVRSMSAAHSNTAIGTSTASTTCGRYLPK